GRRPAAQHARDDDAVVALQTKGLGQVGRDVLGLDAQPAASDVAGGDDLLEDGLRGRGRYGKAYSQRTAGLGINGGIDADEPALGIDQRPARIARVDGGVGLDEVLVDVDAQPIASQGRDYAHGGGLSHAKG